MHQRLTAVAQLVGRTDPESLKTLNRLAGDVELRVARAEIRGIGAIKDRQAWEMLMHVVKTSKNGAHRGTAAAELGNFKETDYKFLVNVLANDKDPLARAGAAIGLERVHDARAVDALVEALADPDPDTRCNAHKAIGRTTGRWFEFNAMAPESVRAEQIAEIKKDLARVKSTHVH